MEIPMHFPRFAARFAVACTIALTAAQAQVPQLPMQGPKPTAATPIAVPPPNPATPAALTQQDVTAFLDGFLPLQLQRDDVAGATISITQNGQTLVQKGYGYSDWKKKTPVDPVTTTFRPGSISKLFTYVSMMQLVEQGKLDLDADVQKYLDFTINPGPAGIGSAPITLRNLATHTSGFEEELHDFGSDKSGKLPLSLRDFLIRNQPHRFAAPGKALAYSNYGVAVIGYIVQRVSGEPFPDYVQHHIFTPLNMTHSTFVQPLPAGFEHTLGYVRTSKPDTGFEGFTETPSGGLSSTAADLAIFGQMLLARGTLNGQRILQPASVATLFTPQFTPAPGVEPWDLGFYDKDRNGLRFIGHGGDLIACHSQFWVEPTHGLTFFISYNSAGAAASDREELFRAFVDRYLPGPPSPHPAYVKLSAKDLAPYTGYYLSARRADSTKLRAFDAASPRVVSATKDGELTISTSRDFRGELLKFHPIGNDSFYEEQSQDTLHFERDAQGRIAAYAGPSYADRAPFMVHPLMLGGLLSFSLLTAALVCFAPIVRLYRRIFQRRRAAVAPQPGTRWMTFPLQIACVCILVVFIQLAVAAVSLGEFTSFYQIGHLDRVFVTQNILTGIALLAIVAGLISGLRTLRRPLRWITKLKFTLVSLACAYFAWFAIYFHFIGNAHHY
jgi:CubicO group peptidase (beta-lactamase class C family)